MSCEDIAPEVLFDFPIDGKAINLSKKIGESIKVLREKDTLSYSFFYDKYNEQNIIVKNHADTIFIGEAVKRKEMFLLQREFTDDYYSVHAIRVSNKDVVGLETEWIQSAIISTEIDSGRFTNLMVDSTDYRILRASKKEAKKLFRSVLNKLEPENRIINEDYFSDSIEIPLENQGIKTDSSKLITKFYPNPVQNIATVKLKFEAPFVFKVFELSGTLMKTVKSRTQNAELDLSNLTSGNYILKVSDSELKYFDEIKFVKQ